MSGLDPWDDVPPESWSGPDLGAPLEVTTWEPPLDPGARLLVVADRLVLVGRAPSRGQAVALLDAEVVALPLDTVTAAGAHDDAALVVGTYAGAARVVSLDADATPVTQTDLDEEDARPEVVGPRLLSWRGPRLTLTTVGHDGTVPWAEADLGGDVVSASGCEIGGGEGRTVVVAAQVGHPSVLVLVAFTDTGHVGTATVPETRPVAPAAAATDLGALVAWATDRGDEIWGMRFDAALGVLAGPERLASATDPGERVQAPRLTGSGDRAAMTWRTLPRAPHHAAEDVGQLVALIDPERVAVGPPRALAPAGGSFSDVALWSDSVVALHGAGATTTRFGAASR